MKSKTQPNVEHVIGFFLHTLLDALGNFLFEIYFMKTKETAQKSHRENEKRQHIA